MSPRPRREIDTSTYRGRFVVRLRELRDTKGMTVRELAEKSGIPKTTIEGWESGERHPTIEHFIALDKILQTTPRNFLPKE